MSCNRWSAGPRALLRRPLPSKKAKRHILKLRRVLTENRDVAAFGDDPQVSSRQSLVHLDGNAYRKEFIAVAMDDQSRGANRARYGAVKFMSS
jgi:hypothetical protein